MSVTPTAAAAAVCSLRRSCGDVGAADAAVGSAGVAVGDDAVRHLATLGGPPRRAARAAEVAIVGMGDDDEDALGGVGLGHGRRW